MAYIGGHTLPTEGTVFARSCFTYSLCCIPALFSGYEYKYEPVLYMADVSSGTRSTPVHLKYPGAAAVNDISGNDSAGTASVLVTHHSGKGTLKMDLKEFSSEILTNNTKVSPGSDNELITGKICVSQSRGKILIGAYGLPNKSRSLGERIQRAVGNTTLPGTANGLFISVRMAALKSRPASSLNPRRLRMPVSSS